MIRRLQVVLATAAAVLLALFVAAPGADARSPHARPKPSRSTTTPSPSPSPTPTPTATAGPLAVRVAGSRLVDAADVPLAVHGVNRSGTQYACSEGWGIFDGPSDAASIAAIAAWRVNTVRVSLNDACWLGVNGVPAAYGGTNYQTAIVGYVNRIHAAGLYVILDLHFANPGTSLQPDQVPMADRDHANTFWSSVAATFKTDPAVMFDLFNEPYPDSNHDTTAAWACVRDGGTCPGVGYQAAGSQEMLNAIRATGATNVVMVGGPQYAGVVDQWTAYAPTDPAGQLAASIHIYWQTPQAPDWSPCYLQACWDSTIAPLAATTPVVIGEVGEHDCNYGLEYGTALNPPQQNLFAWADQHGVGFASWAWFVGNCAAEPALISSYTGTATAYGLGLKNYLAALP
jgi:endoglucanase